MNLSIFHGVHACPAVAQRMSRNGEARSARRFGERSDVGFQNPAHEQPAACVERCGIGRQLRQQDIAVDVGRDEIVPPSGDRLDVAQQLTYLLTYSFPCTDLSVAGKQAGMKKGSGTRSGLLWEVERILKEIRDDGGELPQILFMENVPQVHADANMVDFQNWIDFLTSLGYVSYWQDLNAKNYGVAQNRERCFMFSFLGEYNYHFPQPIPLKKKLKDYLEDDVDEKYYINNEKADKLIKQLIDNGTLPQHNLDRQTDRHALTEQSISHNREKLQTASRQDMTAESQTNSKSETWLLKNRGEVAEKPIDVAVTLMARDYKGIDNYGSNGVIEWK